MTSSAKVDRAELETKVQDMYRAVALHPEATTGRNRLRLDAVGRLHWRGHAAGRLPFGNRGGGFQHPNDRGESELPVYLR